MTWLASMRALGLVALLVLVAGACGGAKNGENAQVDLDADPLALLPSSASALSTVDARAFFDSGPLGDQVDDLVARLMPIGDESGFQAKRDVDRVVVGVYTAQGADVAAIVVGRFDPAKINDAAEKHALTRTGQPLVASTYANRPVFTVANVGFTMLTPKTAVAGTEAGIRRVLDRIQDGRVQRDVTPWMLETLDTKGAAFAFAADFANAPVSSARMGAIKLPWLNGMRVARAIGNFKSPGMNVAATITYGDATQAGEAAQGIRFVDGWLKVLAPFLPGAISLENLEVTAEASDVRCKFSVEESSMRGLISMAAAWIPKAR
jgi:hypothetical protein